MKSASGDSVNARFRVPPWSNVWRDTAITRKPASSKIWRELSVDSESRMVIRHMFPCESKELANSAARSPGFRTGITTAVRDSMSSKKTLERAFALRDPGGNIGAFLKGLRVLIRSPLSRVILEGTDPASRSARRQGCMLAESQYAALRRALYRSNSTFFRHADGGGQPRYQARAPHPHSN